MYHMLIAELPIARIGDGALIAQSAELFALVFQHVPACQDDRLRERTPESELVVRRVHDCVAAFVGDVALHRLESHAIYIASRHLTDPSQK